MEIKTSDGYTLEANLVEDTIGQIELRCTVRNRHEHVARQFTVILTKDGVAVHVPLGETPMILRDGTGFRVDYY